MVPQWCQNRTIMVLDGPLKWYQTGLKVVCETVPKWHTQLVQTSSTLQGAFKVYVYETCCQYMNVFMYLYVCQCLCVYVCLSVCLSCLSCPVCLSVYLFLLKHAIAPKFDRNRGISRYHFELICTRVPFQMVPF